MCTCTVLYIPSRLSTTLCCVWYIVSHYTICITLYCTAFLYEPANRNHISHLQIMNAPLRIEATFKNMKKNAKIWSKFSFLILCQKMKILKFIIWQLREDKDFDSSLHFLPFLLFSSMQTLVSL
jgi:hypothetical protein